MKTSSSTPSFPAGPDNDEIDLREVLAILRRHWWMPVLGALLFLAGALYMQRSEVPTYTAEALLRRQVERSPLDAIGSRLSGGREEDVASQIEVIRSATVLGTAVDAVGLRFQWPAAHPPRSQVITDVGVVPSAAQGRFRLSASGGQFVLSSASGEELDRAPGGSALSGPGFEVHLVARPAIEETLEFSILHRQAAIERLRRGLGLQQAGRTSIIRLRYTSPAPEHSADVVNAVAHAYELYSASQARENARRRRAFLAGQLAQVADSLNVAQQTQLEFQERTGIVNPQVEGQAVITAVLEAEREVRSLRQNETLLTTLNQALATPGEVDEALRRTVFLGGDFVPGAEGMFNRLQELQTQRSRLTSGRFGYTDEGREVEVLDSLIAQNKNEMRKMSEQALEVLSTRRESAEGRLAELQAKVRSVPGRSTGYLRLAQQVQAVQATYDMLAEKYYEAQIAEAVEGGDVEVVEQATPPLSPNPSRRSFKLMLALLVGMVSGTTGVFLLERLDRRVHDSNDVEQATGAVVLSGIPRLTKVTSRDNDGVVVVSKNRTSGAEAFRNLRTMIRFARTEPPQVIVVTSPGPGEGKSTITANLAVTFAQEGKRVLLVDADFPRPIQHKLWDISQEPGLADILVNQATAVEAVRRLPEHGLDVLSSGSEVPSSSELIGSSAFREFLSAMRAKYDLVIIDTPPMLVISDAIMLATFVDGMLLVARAHVTDRNALADAVRSLRHVEAPILGLVLNGVEGAPGYGYGYDFSKYYENNNGDGNVRTGGFERIRQYLFTKLM